jgi:hypothetical protein
MLAAICSHSLYAGPQDASPFLYLQRGQCILLLKENRLLRMMTMYRLLPISSHTVLAISTH